MTKSLMETLFKVTSVFVHNNKINNNDGVTNIF